MHAPESLPFNAPAADAGSAVVSRKSTIHAPGGLTEFDPHPAPTSEPAREADEPERWDGLA